MDLHSVLIYVNWLLLAATVVAIFSWRRNYRRQFAAATKIRSALEQEILHLTRQLADVRAAYRNQVEELRHALNLRAGALAEQLGGLVILGAQPGGARHSAELLGIWLDGKRLETVSRIDLLLEARGHINASVIVLDDNNIRLDCPAIGLVHLFEYPATTPEAPK